MKFQNVVISETATLAPPIALTSHEFETKLAPLYQRLKLPEGRLELQTGIKSRGYWPTGTLPSDISAEVANNLFKTSDILREEIGLLIHSSVCRDVLEPATASMVHAKVGLSTKCINFDLSNACLGFLNAMTIAANLIEQHSIKHALIVTGENAGPLIEQTIEFLNSCELNRKEIKPYFANLTIGSAGVAMILSHRDLSNGPRLIGSSEGCDTSSHDLCQGDGNTDGLMMQTDSETMLHAGVKLAKHTWQAFFDQVLEKNTPDKVVTHQVGIAHRDLLFKQLELESSKDFMTFDTWGNTGSAACPLSFIEALKTNYIKSGELVALLGIGSGLNCQMLGVEC